MLQPGVNAKSALKMVPLLAATVLTAATLSGCAMFGQRDHVVVGSVPDDYRTRHPIVIAESQSQLMVPVGNAARQLNYTEKQVIGGFLDRYREQGNGAIQIMVPSGAPNSGAAGAVANEVASFAASDGFGDRITMNHYQAPHGQPTPPVILAYSQIKASAGPCGKWPADVNPEPENKQYHNFGCAYQNNLAAQVANPMDLLGPRRAGTIDASDRGQVIVDYRTNQGSWSPTLEY
jgi:pilus assembly protein CpaD